MPMGVHLLIELFGCKKFEFDKEMIELLVKDTKSTPLIYNEHCFKPQGKSAFFILEESHISIHTYPEFGYVAVDIFCCGNKSKPYNAIDRLKEIFNPMYLLINEVKRGVSQ